jgi:4-amino-4-deoxy-L-arabinose transferase-like glycosyltransferase
MLLIYVALLLAGTLVIAARRPLWSDELYTYYIATLPSFSDIWSALLTGHEQVPLGFYAIERVFWGVFGVNSVALRLPALLGCLVMSLALFKFVSWRLSPAYGLLAAVFPMTTSAFPYAREARPYGLELGFAALALVCWQQATDSNNR